MAPSKQHSGDRGILDQRQQEVWAQELRRADERAEKFKQQCEDMQSKLAAQSNQINSLKSQIEARDQEIQRLHASYVGGQSFSTVKRVEDVGRLEVERKAMLERFEDMANLLDMPGFRLPEFHAESLDQLFEHVGKLRASLDDAREDRAELERQLE